MTHPELITYRSI